MLPSALKPKSQYTFELGTEWNDYLINIGHYKDLIDIDFLSQICFQHFDRFNEYFPSFDLNKYEIKRIKMSTKDIYNNIRYDKNVKVNFYNFQVDNYLRNNKTLAGYSVLSDTIRNKTWPFPPVIISSTLASVIGTFNYGKPFHLIEGTHRVSFINRLYELNKVEANKEHTLLCITKK